MPELPEVHTTTSMLNGLISGLCIKDVWTDYGSAYYHKKKNIKDKRYFLDFKKNTVGRKILEVSRRGKNVVIHLDNETVIAIHMKMTGHLLYGHYKKDSKSKWKTTEKGPLESPFNQFIHLVFSLSDGKNLVLSDMRKFARISFHKAKNVFDIEELKHIGPEPLDKTFTFSEFKNRLALRPKGKIKQVLLDQEIIAGIGNIYSDEILFESDIHPMSISNKIPEVKKRLMFNATKKLLKKGINFGGDSMSDYRNPLGLPGKFQLHHKAYRNKDKQCKKNNCDGIIERIVVGSRSAHFCPKHQIKY